jgi:hypothetical protein
VLDYKRVLMQRSVRRTSWSYPSRIRQRAIDGDCTDTSAAQEITVGVYGFGAARFLYRVALDYFLTKSWCDAGYPPPIPARRTVDRPKYIKWCTRGDLGHFGRREAKSARLVIASYSSPVGLSSPVVALDGSPLVTIRLDFFAFLSGLNWRQSCVGSR